MIQLLGRVTKFSMSLLSVLILSPLYLIVAAQIALAAVVCGVVSWGVVYFLMDYANGQFELALPAQPLAVVWGAAVTLYMLAHGLYTAVRRGEWPQ